MRKRKGREKARRGSKLFYGNWGEGHITLPQTKDTYGRRTSPSSGKKGSQKCEIIKEKTGKKSTDGKKEKKEQETQMGEEDQLGSREAERKWKGTISEATGKQFGRGEWETGTE